MPGVTVLLKGSNNGISTNSDGTYTLTVPAGDGTLVFSSIGYITVEQPIGTNSQINVGLATDSKQLSEVVVTALGIQRESRAVGYAVTEVKSAAIVQKSEPDVLRALQGKIPGVNIVGSNGAPGSSTRLTIRGNTSLQGNNQPLYIVDGVPFNNAQNNSESQLVRGSAYSNRAADIDPNNIESINVLKGMAAAALYGSRAANGVIVITTKTGSRNRDNKGIRVGYNSSYSIERIANLPEYQNTYGSGGNFVYSEANGSWGPAFGSAQAPADVPHPYRNIAAFPEFATARYPYQPFENNVKDFFETGKLIENSVNLSASSENASFNTVLSRSDQSGMIPFSKFDRTSLSAGGSGQFNKLRIGGNVTYVNSNQQGPQLGANNAIGNASAFARIMFMPRNLDLTGLPNTNPVTRGPVFGWLNGQADNPYWSVANNSYKSNVDRVAVTTNIGYDILKWLNFSFNGGVNTYSDRRVTAVRPGSVAFNGAGNVIQDNLRNSELESTALLTADQNLTEDISIKAIVGANINQRQFESSSVSGNTYLQFDIDDIQNTRQVINNGTGFSKRRLFGVLGDLTLGYKDFVYLNATARNDWSSTLPKANRSFFYPSVSASLIFTEAFGIESNILNMGKLRAGYAKAGNDAAPYSLITTYGLQPFYGNNVGGTQFPITPTNGNTVSGAAIGGFVGDPNLTPEFSNEVEVGTDLNFLKDRVIVSATYYDKRTTNQIANVPLPSASGFTTYITNFGEISNKGIEGALTVIPVDAGGFRWTSIANFTRNRNIVEKLREGVEQVVIAANFGDIQAVHRPGQPYGLLIGSVAARDNEGNLLINPSTGRMLTAINPEIVGNPNPDYTIGFINTFSYKGLTLEGVIDFRKGGDLYSTTLQSYLGRGVTKDTEDRDRNVIINGFLGNPGTFQPLTNADGSKIPNNVAVSLNDYYFGAGSAAINGASEFSVFDGTTLRLREITLGYDLPAKLLSKTPIRGVNLSLSGRNLWWYSPNIPKYTNFDPETSTFGASNAQGFEFTNAPTARRYGVNLRVNF
ncbi:SusC/RagA family TonB-linked outer membrane protein [Hymenobacter glacieicola]|uniref:SusC/RagA family TonB-linked outer membrane protein n=1 Tax=Hymenobacter glacieicola TaxID=1562124 RepID=A0ABQ1X6I7_9BACT|nr:SusC/RagA family TonB-linked outer membrane protein [Hymenobacter glacieicola]